MEDKEELTSLITVLNQLKQEGYQHDFKITEDDRICTMDGKECFRKDEIQITDFYRFEGQSNPDDMAILYVLETTSGLKGTITDAYGTYGDSKVEDFMKGIHDLGKDLDSRR